MIAVLLRCMCLSKIPSQSGWNEISEVELVYRDFTQLSKRYTERKKEALFPSHPLTACVYLSYTLTQLSCSTVNVSVMGLIARAACQPSPTSRALFPLSSPFLDIFKRMLRESQVHTQRTLWLLKQSCVSLDYWDLWECGGQKVKRV